jgi:hypothetical protein
MGRNKTAKRCCFEGFAQEVLESIFAAKTSA